MICDQKNGRQGRQGVGGGRWPASASPSRQGLTRRGTDSDQAPNTDLLALGRMEQRGSRGSQAGAGLPAEVLQLNSPAPSPARSLGKRSDVPFSPSKGSAASPGPRVHSRPSARESPSGKAPDSSGGKGSAVQAGQVDPRSSQGKAGKENPLGADSDIAKANALMERRLRERYGPGGMPEAAIAHVKQLRFDSAQEVGERPKPKLIGRDVPGCVGQIVRHSQRGKHTAGKFDFDYFSGDDTGTVLSVSGDYAEVHALQPEGVGICHAVLNHPGDSLQRPSGTGCVLRTCTGFHRITDRFVRIFTGFTGKQ